MNLDLFVLTLIQGLLTNVEEKSHVNGAFTPYSVSTPKRCLSRGSDGPLLFIVATQPLMMMLDRCCSGRELIGLKLSNQASLLYQLFAHDACLFLQNLQMEFTRARATIQMFENMFRAQLNVGKFAIIPLSNPTT